MPDKAQKTSYDKKLKIQIRLGATESETRAEGIAGSNRAPATALLGLPCEALWPAVAVSELCLRLWCAHEAP